jgi:ferredoxin-NADP reductase
MTQILIQEIESLSHNVKRIVTSKPEGYDYTPGQATLVSIDRDGLREEKRPFTFTSLPGGDHLEFVIKIYPRHDGVTDEIDDLKVGDTLLIEEAWGAIQYQGPGTFIAGGAGITPFLAILRKQAVEGSNAERQLIFSNKTQHDLFLTRELAACTAQKLLLTFTEETVNGAEHGRVDMDFLKKHVTDFSQNFYVCGPPSMVESVSEALVELGADADLIVKEAA